LANGEVCVRGRRSWPGIGSARTIPAVFVDGALRTGDVGHLDEDGYLYLVDRLKDVILSGGYNVYPRVIEEAAYLHPAIEEAIAIGIPDKYRGQSAKLSSSCTTARPPAPRKFSRSWRSNSTRSKCRARWKSEPAQDHGRQAVEEGTGGRGTGQGTGLKPTPFRAVAIRVLRRNR
jgi:acyl-CoA synthetase (AMP-forming)/AMP-acid ligase II